MLITVLSFVWSSTGQGQSIGKEMDQQPLVGKTVAISRATPEVQETPVIVPQISDPATSLRTAKFIFVRSTSLLVGTAVVEEKLRKRQEFQQLGLLVTRDVRTADLILEVRHDLFTMYVYTAIDPRTRVVVASGKLSSLGGTVAAKVAERFMKQLIVARRGR